MNQKGFSLFELLAALVVVSILTVIAIPMFGGNGLNCDNPRMGNRGNPCPSCSYTMRAKIASVIKDIGEINIQAQRFELNNGRYPVSLDEIGLGGKTDPWGQPYVFFDYSTNPPGHRRKDHDLHEINTRFDVYTVGKDGVSAPPFTSQLSQDDIVMANDGQWIGPACHYNGSGKNK